MEGVSDLELKGYSRLRAISAVAVPACLQNAAGPVTSALQTALLANYAGSQALAAFAAVSISANFASRVFNFLVDGVSAKVGKSVGQRAWGELAFRVQLSLCCGLGAGVIASLLLAVLKVPISQYVLALTAEVLLEAESYWWLRCGLVPVLLFNMSVSGILQGYHQVRVSALLNTTQSLLELAGSAAVLVKGVRLLGCSGLLAMGWVTVITQLQQAAAGFCCILLMSPREEASSGPSFRLFDAWFGPPHAPIVLGGSGGGGRGMASSQWWCRKWWQAQQKQLGVGTMPDVEEPLLVSGMCDSASSLGLDDVKAVDAECAATPADAVPQAEGVALGGAASQINGSCQQQQEGQQGSVGAEIFPAALPTAFTCSKMELLSSEEFGSEVGEEEMLALLTVQRRELEAAARKEHFLDFVRDGLNMLVRSMVIQVTFFASLVAASRLGTDSLAAHSIISQLWFLISYLVDGFAAAGIVLGSRLAAHAHNPSTAAMAKKQFKRLIRRVLTAGLMCGIAAGVIFALFRRELVHLFTPDLQIQAILEGGSWLVMVLVQPVNGMVFVYDGLMYASQSFSYIRNMMLLGLALAFAPLMALEQFRLQALWGVWAANAAVNLWRLCGAAWLIHGKFMKEFDGSAHQREGGMV